MPHNRYLKKKEQELILKPWITKDLNITTNSKYTMILNTLIRKSKIHHCKLYFEANLHNSKKTWLGINKINLARNK